MVRGCTFYDRASPKVRENPNSLEETAPITGQLNTPVKLSAIRHPFLFAIWHHVASPLTRADGPRAINSTADDPDAEGRRQDRTSSSHAWRLTWRRAIPSPWSP